MKIHIFCGGPSSEHDVSLASAQEIYTHIDHTKYDVSLFYINTNLQAAILTFGPGEDAVSSAISILDINSCLPLDSVLSQLAKEKKPHLAFIAAMHGEFGEDGTLQKILEDKNIPYTGSAGHSSALAFDKSRALKEISCIKGLHTPTSTRFTKEHKDSQTIFPVIVKPNSAGSSVGVHLVQNKDQLQKIPTTDMIIEEYIDGIELSCGCLEKANGDFVQLPAVEIIPSGATFFDYNAKYQLDGAAEIIPPKNISSEISLQISELACTIHSSLGCRTYSRSDFIVKNGDIYYIETNTLPGFTGTSLFPKEANAFGMNFTSLIEFIIEQSI